ncbi:hypothetical protein NPIL_336741 [Nephila pilipes]|uniref:Uncharacterized protein n=1 Tax=Nephila pilipes TaxID=299642 RepID=A0A8X6PIB8_NEPPI|nr:hypothetical protein NPIL_336741 [Nephila pilipes]
MATGSNPTNVPGAKDFSTSVRSVAYLLSVSSVQKHTDPSIVLRILRLLLRAQTTEISMRRNGPSCSRLLKDKIGRPYTEISPQGKITKLLPPKRQILQNPRFSMCSSNCAFCFQIAHYRI